MEETIELWRWYERGAAPGVERKAVMAVARHNSAYSILVWALDAGGRPKESGARFHATDGFAEGDSYKYLLGLKPLGSSLPSRRVLAAVFGSSKFVTAFKLALVGL